MKTNILVIGSGISGLTYAIKVAGLNPQLNLVIISKNNLLESNTKYAQGGIAVVSNFQKDSFDKHVQDTLTAGAGACDEAVVRFVVEEGHERLNELIKWSFQVIGGSRSTKGNGPLIHFFKPLNFLNFFCHFSST